MDDIAHRLLAYVHRLEKKLRLLDRIVARHTSQIEGILRDLRHNRSLRRLVDELGIVELCTFDRRLHRFRILYPALTRRLGRFRRDDRRSQIVDRRMDLQYPKLERHVCPRSRQYRRIFTILANLYCFTYRDFALWQRLKRWSRQLRKLTLLLSKVFLQRRSFARYFFLNLCLSPKFVRKRLSPSLLIDDLIF